MNIKKYAVYLALIPFFASAEVLEVDKSHSEVHFSVSHMVVSKTKGEFSEFDAEVEVVDDKLVSVKATIPVSSIDTDNEKRDNHLKSADFFNAEKYPDILFESTAVKDGKLHGKLTIMETTQEIVLDLEFLGPVKNPWGKMVYGLNLEGEIDRNDFGLTWNKALETGGVVVGDKVKISISVELNK
ncbi:YceI family protein [Kiritimatiellaeota bacterium B1221]|nr:YceI family protein [Kiritimatiellaeota bacterium B1221]